MKKLLKLFVVAALAVSMTLCCVACGANYSPVTDANKEEVAQTFADKIDKEAPIGTETKDGETVVKRAIDLGMFLNLEADVTLDGVGIKGKTKDELIFITSVEHKTEQQIPDAVFNAKFKTEDSLSFSGTAEQVASLLDKIGALQEDEEEYEPYALAIGEAHQVTPIEALIDVFLNKSGNANGEITLVDGVVYVNGKVDIPGAKGEMKALGDLKPMFNGAEGYAWTIASYLEEEIYGMIDAYGEYINKDTLLFVFNILGNLGLNVSADVSSFSLKLEAGDTFAANIKTMLGLDADAKLDIKTLALTLNLNSAGKIVSAKLEVNVDADLTYADIAIKGNVKGTLEVKTEGLSVSAPSNTNDYLVLTDVLSVLPGRFAR